METVCLLYNLQNKKGAKIKMLCHKMKIPFKSVEKVEYSMTIQQLTDEAPCEHPAETDDFDDEMLLFSGFSNQQINDILKGLHSSKSNVALKAVVTDYNRGLTSKQLHDTIKSEHLALHQK